MAYDYDKMKTAYESLTKEQQRQVAEQNKDNANFQQFAVDYTKERYGTGTSTPTTPKQETPTGGPADGYATASERNAATGGAEFISQTNSKRAETPAVVKEETKTETVTPEVKQEGALTPLSQDYYNQTSQDAQDKIVKNLEEYKKSNPEYFTDYESFKKNFSYDARNDAQKNTLDQWFNGYQKGLELATVPTTDLYTQYNNGDISNADLEILRANNPTKYSELMNQINKGNIIAAYDDDKGTDVLDFKSMAYEMMQKAFMSFMGGDNTTGASQFFRDYEEKMESPEMMELSDQATEYENQIELLQDDIAAMQKAVEKEHEGTGASRSKIAAIVADRTYELQLQLRTANSNYKKVATQYNNRMQQYQNEFQLQLQEYQLNQQERNQKMQELGFAMDMLSFETPEQAQERQWNYWVKQQEYTNGDINSKDYSTRYKAALKSVQNLLAEYEGIPMERSAEQMAQDILKAIDNGSDLGTELTKLNKLIQGKDEYKYMYNQTYGTGAASGLGKTFKIGNTEYVIYNDQLYTSDQFNSIFGGQQKAYTQVNADVFNTYSDGRRGTLGYFFSQEKNGIGKIGGQCGKYVNDYLQEIGVTGAANRYYDDELSTKLNSINSNTAKKGTIAVFDFNHISKSTGKNHGHVAIVTDVLKDGRFVVQESNYELDANGNGKKTITQRIVDPNDASLKGFFDPSKPPQGSSSVTDTATIVDSNGKLTDTGATQLAKDLINGEVNYSEVKAAYGDDGLNLVENKRLELLSNGYQKSLKITDPTKILNAEKDYMTKFNSLNEEVNEALQWTDKMNVALNAITEDKHNDKKTLNGASQVIVNAFNKLMDPDSVIRESEYARTPEGQAFFAKVQGKLEQVSKGGAGLTYENLKGLVDLANELSNGYQNRQNELAQLIKNNADTYGLNINNILPISVIEGLNNSNMSGGIQSSNFFQTWANTAYISNSDISLSNGMTITRP